MVVKERTMRFYSINQYKTTTALWIYTVQNRVVSGSWTGVEDLGLQTSFRYKIQNTRFWAAFPFARFAAAYFSRGY